jgi:hypothetical protein
LERRRAEAEIREGIALKKWHRGDGTKEIAPKEKARR